MYTGYYDIISVGKVGLHITGHIKVGDRKNIHSRVWALLVSFYKNGVFPSLITALILTHILVDEHKHLVV